MSDPTLLDSTRASYDTVAAGYSALVQDDLDQQPTERALLALFAELAAGPSLDVGCGPGHVTAFLARQGLDVSGVDLSPGMIEQARGSHPDLRFEVGSMAALEHPDGSLSGICAWLSIIHVSDDELPGVLTEFHRVLTDGGALLLVFQLGDGPRRLTRAWGHDIDLTFWFRRPDAVTAVLREAGFHVHVTTVFEPTGRSGMRVAGLVARRLD